MPRVSVIIPAFNCENYIEAALASVFQQNFGDLELIVVDDGSTDGTPRILADYKDRVRLVAQENRGVASARNTGLAIARGDFVGFLDADDWWLPGRLAAQFAALESFPDAGLIFSDFCVFGNDVSEHRHSGIRWKYRFVRDPALAPWHQLFSMSRVINWHDDSRARHEAITYHGWVATTLFQGNFILTSSVLVRRKAICRHGGFDCTLDTEEDYDCWLKLANDWPFSYIDAPLVAFRRNPNQLTRPGQLERIGRNALTVVERASTRMAGSISKDVMRARRSLLDRDLGVICLRGRRNTEARGFLWLSLRQHLRQPLVMILLMLTLLPPGLFDMLERFRRTSRQRTQAPLG